LARILAAEKTLGEENRCKLGIHIHLARVKANVLYIENLEFLSEADLVPYL
jgi:hypothetical protein